MTTGALSEPTIPVSPQAAGPAVSERKIGAGGVPGCSAMPGAWKSQPAPGKARGFRVQDTVEHHGGLDVVVEKIVQWEQENPASNGREMIDDFRLRGPRTWRRMGDTATRGGGAGRWCTILTITNLHYQRAKPSPLWSRLCPGIRIGRGLARIPRILRGKAPCGAGIVRPRPARPVVAPHGRGRKWREPPFLPLVRHRRAFTGAHSGAR